MKCLEEKCKKQGTPFCLAHTPMSECGICLEESYLYSLNNVTLFCKHIFCQKCINAWIVEKGNESNCPTCRTKINNQFVNCVLYFERRRIE